MAIYIDVTVGYKMNSAFDVFGLYFHLYFYCYTVQSVQYADPAMQCHCIACQLGAACNAFTGTLVIITALKCSTVVTTVAHANLVSTFLHLCTTDSARLRSDYWDSTLSSLSVLCQLATVATVASTVQ